MGGRSAAGSDRLLPAVAQRIGGSRPASDPHGRRPGSEGDAVSAQPDFLYRQPAGVVDLSAFNIENTIIIGDSLQHGFIVMICVGENAGVYYYDDSYYFEESNDEGNVYWIAENFEEFWKMLKNY